MAAAGAILTNEILFGVVRDRHCSADSPNRIEIKDNKDFKFAIKETIEFLSSFECLLIKLSKSGRVALGKSRRRYYWSAKDGCGAMTVCHCVPPATKSFP